MRSKPGGVAASTECLACEKHSSWTPLPETVLQCRSRADPAPTECQASRGCELTGFLIGLVSDSLQRLLQSRRRCVHLHSPPRLGVHSLCVGRGLLAAGRLRCCSVQMWLGLWHRAARLQAGQACLPHGWGGCVRAARRSRHAGALLVCCSAHSHRLQEDLHSWTARCGSAAHALPRITIFGSGEWGSGQQAWLAAR